MPLLPMRRSRQISGWALAAVLVLAAGVEAPVGGATPDEPEDAVAVRGIVIDSAGRPVANANVCITGNPWTFHAALAEGRAGADGSFAISFRKSQFSEVYDAWENTVVAAAAPGLPPAWARWDDVDASGRLVLRLSPDDTPIEGRILDLEGRPVGGARVRIRQLTLKAPDFKRLSLGGTDESEDRAIWTPSLPGYAIAIPQPIIAGPDGRFRISGLGANRTATLIVEGPGIALSSLDVQTRPVPMQTRTFLPDIAARPNTLTVYGATFDFAAPPGRTATGTVRDAQTGQPLGGVTVRSSVYELRTVTDANGRYTLEGLPKKKGIRLTAIPNDQQPYVMRDADVPEAPGLGPVAMDFELHKGVWITGRVTDKVTGKPVLTRINYLPYLTNKYAQALPEFHETPLNEIPGPQDRYNTRADGTYRVVALPGPALVAAWFSKYAYLRGVGAEKVKCPTYRGQAYQVFRPWISMNSAEALADVDIPEGVEDTTINFQLDPGITIHIDIVDPDGKPAAGVVVAPGRPGYNSVSRQKVSTFEAVAFKPDEKRRYFFRDNARGLGKVVEISPTKLPDHKFTVHLEPLASVNGRLIGADGQPVANARIDTGLLATCSTDAQGEFRIELMPGYQYRLQGRKGRAIFETDAADISAAAGSSRNLGDVHMKVIFNGN
jgi:hypothetical protein